MLEQTTAGGLFTGTTGRTSVDLASRSAKPSSEQEDIGVYRLRSSGTGEVLEEQKYMWRRLFRIVDRPKSPPIVLDCESLGVEATEEIANHFWNDPHLFRKRNLVLTASAASTWDEFVIRCRSQREDLIIGDNWGILILEEPHVELPALLRTAAELGGWIATTGRTICDKTKRIRCSGVLTDVNTSLFGKRDGEMERRLGVAAPR